MKEIFRDKSTVTVGHYKSILEDAGILVMVRNESLALTEVPIPVFFPALCVMNDDDAERAIEILRAYQAKEKEVAAGEDEICSKCSEPNPPNFETCWSCSEVLG